MLGFVPQPNLQNPSIYRDFIFKSETQQIDWASSAARHGTGSWFQVSDVREPG
jgi:hypothetical protein